MSVLPVNCRTSCHLAPALYPSRRVFLIVAKIPANDRTRFRKKRSIAPEVAGCPSSLIGRAGGYQTFDPVPFSGAYNVIEGFGEFGIPILKDVPFAQALDLNLAGRYAYYSNSGQALSWKAGFTWRPIDDVLLRFSQSRDIRAPNILELFNPRSTNAANVLYPVNGVQTTTAYTGLSYGSTSLKPEKAITTTGGAVYQPSWFPGFNVSLDWYRIFVGDAIGQLGGQNIVNQCFAGGSGAAQYCALISQTGTNPLSLTISNPELNLGYIEEKGVDLEASYVTDLFGGSSTFARSPTIWPRIRPTPSVRPR